MKKKLFEDYYNIQGEIKVLQGLAGKLKEKIEVEMDKEELDQVKADYGTFYFSTRKAWTYSKKIIALIKPKKEQIVKLTKPIVAIEIAIREIENQAREDGSATAEESRSLSFRSK